MRHRLLSVKALGAADIGRICTFFKALFFFAMCSQNKSGKNPKNTSFLREGNNNYYVRETKSAWTFFPPMPAMEQKLQYGMGRDS